ncbi:D-hydantoinase [Sporomusa carbonis]|uniref:dihydropyrimidinase n=1 Tax=Sporomusa carbonis TaxID=3076075 RepID=UPI003A743BC3
MAIILTGGTVVTAVDCYRADVRIDGEKITAIGYKVQQPGDECIDARDCYLFPGGIDPHTHFDLPVGATITADDFASGTRAAAVGGTTTVLDFATQNRGESLARAVANWHAKATGNSYVDYGFHLAVSELSPGVLEEMACLPHTAGITSVKLYMAYKDVLQVDDGTLLRMLLLAKELGMLVCVHCENGDIIDVLVTEAKAQGRTAPKYHALTRPVAAEREATARAVCLAEVAGAPLYVVHVSSAAALDVIREARGKGLAIYAETCPQYLLLDESCYQTQDFSAAKYVMSPPLRPAANQAALWAGLCEGSLATTGSDHCSFNLVGQKELGRDDFSRIPNGGPGVENRFGLLYTYGVAAGKLTLNQFVAVTATNAAKLFGLFPQKGTLAVGSDADIVVWDPAVKTTISAGTQLQQVDYNLYEGMTQIGKARHVFLRGQHIVNDGRLTDDAPAGRYLMRRPYAAGGDSRVSV